MSKKSTSSEPHRVRLTRDYESTDRAAAILAALTPEIGAIPGNRSATTVTRDERTLIVTVQAADLSALRAAKQTWISLLQTAENTTA